MWYPRYGDNMSELVGKDIEDVLGEAAYVVGRNIVSNIVGPIEFFDSVMDVTGYLDSYSVASEGELRLLNGVVANVLSIPKSIPNSLEIMLLLPHAYSTDNGIIVEIKTLQQLEEAITSIVKDVIEIDESSELSQALIEINTQKIEDIYVLYGYEIELYYHFDPMEQDEEMVDSAEKVYKKIKENQ